MRLAKLCRVALALLYFLISTASYSQDMESKCDSPFRIYFGNGVQNSDIDWDASREAPGRWSATHTMEFPLVTVMR